MLLKGLFFFKFLCFSLVLKLFHRCWVHPWVGQSVLQALVQAFGPELTGWPEPSSTHLSRLLRRAFMKKLLTVASSRPSCWAMVTWSSLDGRLFSLKMAWRVRLCTSVNTSRGFLLTFPLSLRPWSCSLRLHAVKISERGHSNERASVFLKQGKIY